MFFSLTFVATFLTLSQSVFAEATGSTSSLVSDINEICKSKLQANFCDNFSKALAMIPILSDEAEAKKLIKEAEEMFQEKIDEAKKPRVKKLISKYMKLDSTYDTIQEYARAYAEKRKAETAVESPGAAMFDDQANGSSKDKPTQADKEVAILKQVGAVMENVAKHHPELNKSVSKLEKRSLSGALIFLGGAAVGGAVFFGVAIIILVEILGAAMGSIHNGGTS